MLYRKLLNQLSELIESHEEVVSVLSDIVKCISLPKNRNCTVAELHDAMHSAHPHYFEAPSDNAMPDGEPGNQPAKEICK